MRNLIIGDIHGCYQELQLLLEEFGFSHKDRIIAVGDIIGRGPDPAKCLDLLKSIEAICLFGNHESWLLHEIESGEYGTEKSKCSYFDAEPYLEYIKTFKYFIEEENYIVVHAGFNHKIPINQNTNEDLVNLRYLHTNVGKLPWYKNYNGKKHVYFGHWAALGFFHNNYVTCLDGGCVYGNLLIGFCPEENKFYKVKAKQCYQPIIVHQHKS